MIKMNALLINNKVNNYHIKLSIIKSIKNALHSLGAHIVLAIAELSSCGLTFFVAPLEALKVKNSHSHRMFSTDFLDQDRLIAKQEISIEKLIIFHCVFLIVSAADF